jgi:hypothetical protein
VEGVKFAADRTTPNPEAAARKLIVKTPLAGHGLIVAISQYEKPGRRRAGLIVIIRGSQQLRNFIPSGPMSVHLWTLDALYPV